MIVTLTLTIFIESLVVAGYAFWQKKPSGHLLLSCLCANLVTQSLLWIMLTAFPRSYLETLLVAEVCIWGIESAILFFYHPNRLKLGEAVLLSLAMNLASFSIGWFLPV